MRKHYTKMDEESYSDEDEMEQDNVPYHFYEHVNVSRTYVYYICGSVKDPHYYIDMVHRITMAGPQDVVYIHLNTQGGNISTGIQIINAMQNSAAKIITVLESEAHSLGTLLFLAGDEYIVNDNCRMMFHNFSSAIFGKGNELTAQLQSTVKWFNKICKQLYHPFLTDDEMEKMVRGEDLWFDSDDIKKRLNKIVRDMENAEMAAKNKEVAKPKEKPKAKAKASAKTKPKDKVVKKSIAEEHTPDE